jgi:UDP-2,3-diacylglucosamine pyrophosphatase LpxH
MNAYSGEFFQPERRLMGEWERAAPIRTGLPPDPVRLHRTIFISDTHLGTRGCKAAMLADFLAHNDCRTLYLVGDILDGWQFKNWYWDEAHRRVLDEILFKAASGTRVVYIAGNHDEALRAYAGLTVAGVELQREAIHETADGRRLLVIHGDQFDGIVAYAKWLAHLGDTAYAMALQVNDILHRFRKFLGLPYWSLSNYLKTKVKNAVQFISNFEQTVVRAAAAAGADGVVCGHIHHPVIRTVGGILYCNDGDWIENCTALVENGLGRLELIAWTECAGEGSLAPQRNLPAMAPVRDRLREPALST